ncbi:hypothetical protein N7462_009708 [Penicillium macrosclerotiorum]|uniref:uncharacterized protein n=1 Tax=Penicillium macrosclerotiorum TaxID=303699 RepID=UPI002549B09E|nr:uncharacterized protein N7462_009708 [Penicillium macrosclerotiorum]KAJ5674269.1 hypothetical protein N7462_009708 [Penicillium macrosclerotiorum]
MATPEHVNIGNLNGRWIIQGIKFLTRKAVSYLRPMQIIQMDHIFGSSNAIPFARIKAITSSGGIFPSITEIRDLTWQWSHRMDFLFGSIKHRNQWIHGFLDTNGRSIPNLKPITEIPDPKIKMFLTGQITPEGLQKGRFLVESAGPIALNDNKGMWVHTFDVNEDRGWTTEQRITDAAFD